MSFIVWCCNIFRWLIRVVYLLVFRGLIVDIDFIWVGCGFDLFVLVFVWDEVRLTVITLYFWEVDPTFFKIGLISTLINQSLIPLMNSIE